MKKTWCLLSKIAYTLLLGIILCVLQASTQPVYAQKTVSGTIIDETNMPLIGVTVMIKGTTTGTISDIDGNYSISVPNNNAILQYSFIGYITQSITVGNQSVINITMKEDLQNLEEVVVVGYGTQRKSHLTGSVSRLRGDGLDELPISRLDQALQGRIAGVNIQNTTSEVGEAPQIRIRGTGSISASSEPLIVVDGFPMTGGGGLESINAGDVLSIEVLKDAAAAAIYGSRAANGVIIVTTRGGSVSKPKFTFKAFTGTKSAYSLHPVMNTIEYVEMLEREAALGGPILGNMEKAQRIVALNNGNTDWQREGLRDNAMIYNAQFSVYGGKKDLNYYFSTAYTEDQGVMIDNDYTKFNMRAKMNAFLSEKIKFGFNFAPSYSKRQRPAVQFIDFYRFYSWMPVRHTPYTSEITGKPVGDYAHGRDFNNIRGITLIDPTTGESPFSQTTLINMWQTTNNNPRSIMDNDKRYQTNYQMNGMFYLSFELAKGLELKTSNGFNVKYLQNDEYRNKMARRDGEPNQATFGSVLTTDLLSENALTYDKKINKHDFNILGGFTAQQTNFTKTNVVGINAPTDLVKDLNQMSQILSEPTYNFREKTALISLLSRVTYSYADKYLMSASVRGDQSSLFYKGHQWAVFPSVSMGWRMSEEGFMKQFEWIDQFKWRASWGMTGNKDIAAYAYLTTMDLAAYPLGNANGNVVPGLANTSGTIGNPDVSWESTFEYNGGADIAVLGSRLSLSVEYYYSITNRLLFLEPILAITGYSTYWNNIGKVRNKGIDFELSSVNVLTRNFEWQTSLNISGNRNRLLELGNGEERLINYGERNEIYLAQVGGPAIQFFGYKAIGVWNSAKEIENNPHHNLDVPGGLRVANTNGDDIINDEDRVPLGNPYPDFTWGITNTFKYRDWDFSFMFQGVQGVDVINGDGYYQEIKRIDRNFNRNRWISEEHPGDGRTPYFTNGIPWELTDYLIEDGSYIALRDVTLGYKLPRKALRSMGVTSFRAYATAQNLFYIMASGYRGINPEARMTYGEYATPLIAGYQRGGFPIQRAFTVGFDITF
ncbi:MAG: TonB-dependent receptor [Dysgonamonadaceae bacterium]|jgi:TonB-linked SusC/RagA family outer membrane protein|nr:TonB-dependent receptor [Dysgonamonadaceae bacterium]